MINKNTTERRRWAKIKIDGQDRKELMSREGFILDEIPLSDKSGMEM